MSPRLFYRTVAIAEAVTWTLLITGMLLKYVAGLGDLPVLIGGSLHGLVFITYSLAAVLVGINQRWSAGLMTLAVFTAIIPYATVPFDIRADRRGLLAGGWRRVATDDPRDQGWVSAVLRWLLNRPVMLIAGFAVAVLGIMTVLLTLGPPGGRS